MAATQAAVATAPVRRAGRRAGYTLVEVLIAMIMFGIITLAASMAISNGLRAHQQIEQQSATMQEVRSVFGILTRDFQAAYASQNNLHTTFTATGDSTGTLLTFTTLAHRVQGPIQTDSSLQTGVPDSSVQLPPQSDLATVQYVFNPDTRTLSRLETSVGAQDNLPEPETPSTVISRHVRSITLEYYDPNNGQRTDWSYNADASQLSSSDSYGGSAATNGQTSTSGGATGADAGTGTDSSATTGDTTLPTSVQITIEFDSADGGQPIRFSTTVNIQAPTPQPAGQTPAATTTSGGSGNSGGTPGGTHRQ